MMSSVGNVVGGSGIAILQSAGAGGYGVPIVHGCVQGVGAAVAALGCLRARMKRSGGRQDGADQANKKDGMIQK
jgi:hypothetical protein